MKKIILSLFVISFSLLLTGQNYEFAEPVKEQLEKENLDLTLNSDFEEIELSEEKYYQYVNRNGGTDTILGFKWRHNNQQWILRNRIIKYYDADENITGKLFQHLNHEGNWVNGLHYTYTYNANGKRTSKTIQYWHKFNQEWINYFKRTNVFNNDLLTGIKTQRWAKDSAIWVNRHHKIFTYSADTLVADTLQTWKFIANAWKSHHFTKYHYNPLGNCNGKLTFHWDKIHSVWRKDHRLLYHYNDDTLVNVVLKQSWKKFQQDWKNEVRHLLAYNDDGKRVKNITQKFIFNSWKGVELRKFNYNQQGKIALAVFKHKNPWQLTWHNYKQVKFEYDDDGNMNKKLIRHWNEYFQEWYNYRLWKVIIEYKSVFAGIADNTENDLKLSYPNPYFQGAAIQLSGNDNDVINVKIYDLSGRIIHEENPSNNTSFTIDRQLNKGIYLICAFDDKGIIKTEKIMVE